MEGGASRCLLQGLPGSRYRAWSLLLQQSGPVPGQSPGTVARGATQRRSRLLKLGNGRWAPPLCHSKLDAMGGGAGTSHFGKSRVPQA